MIPAFSVGKCFWRAVLVASCAWVVHASAATTTPNPRDTLVYKDGDRVQGVLVGQTGDTIVFKSDRFGELRVRAADAVIIKADKLADRAPAIPVVAQSAQTTPPVAPPAPVTEKKPSVVAAEKAEQERVTVWDRFSLSVLTARMRNYFGPWHGRIAISTEVVSDIAKRNNTSYEAQFLRKWKADEIQMSSRYDYSETNDVTTTDLMKLTGMWRHDFNKELFMQYRPTGEWNRASVVRGVPNDYVLLQQELGLGYNVLVKPARKLRVGVSENLFDTWNSATIVEHHTTRGVASVFEETEFALPWRITISQRGVWYPVPGQHDGWENRFDVNKKLTETLSASLRHEIRRHNPDGTAQDYDRLKLLFGVDF